MSVMFFERYPEPIWVPAVVPLHYRILMNSVLSILVFEETVVLAVNKVVVHSCVKAWIGDPTVGEQVERTARFPRGRRILWTSNEGPYIVTLGVQGGVIECATSCSCGEEVVGGWNKQYQNSDNRHYDGCCRNSSARFPVVKGRQRAKLRIGDGSICFSIVVP